MEPQGKQKTNRLAREKSPYLLQHQHNPVDWYAWGEEAFDKARAENKPIFLSIGYSTCHWCHVMERESFENQAVADYLNEHFISIKVDREERPDVDQIYMTFVQLFIGNGGWPLNVFLTPDHKPFFGGTYWPPENRHGRAGFLTVLQHVTDAWQTRQDDLLNSADQVRNQITAHLSEERGPVETADYDTARHKAARAFKSVYDPQNGGFSDAPKFPQPSVPLFLLNYGKELDHEAVSMVLTTCDRMADGGINDQLGGGFSRYSVDERWLVPHFEKMLYDNAQLVQLYLDTFLVSGEQRHANAVRKTLDYILRDMTHPDGGFYSAEDADSEGHEGKFYCWTTKELESLLAKDEYAVAKRYFGITEQGNFLDHSHPAPLQGQNVLSVANPQLSSEEAKRLQRAVDIMIQARNQRVRPQRDDKILVSWNGLMLGAMARAGIVLNEQRYAIAAENNVRFVRERLWDESTGTLYHRWREGERDKVQLLTGYAFYLNGLIDLYEITLNPDHLSFAIKIAETLLERFYDKNEGGFWISADPGLILKLKSDHDGAEPSGNSVAVLSLLKLAAITGRHDFKEAALTTLDLNKARLEQQPHALPVLLQALSFVVNEPLRIVISGNPVSPQVRSFLQAVHAVYLPQKIVLGTEGPVDSFSQGLRSDEPKVYLCTGSECRAPLTDLQEVRTAVQSV